MGRSSLGRGVERGDRIGSGAGEGKKTLILSESSERTEEGIWVTNRSRPWGPSRTSLSPRGRVTPGPLEVSDEEWTARDTDSLVFGGGDRRQRDVDDRRRGRGPTVVGIWGYFPLVEPARNISVFSQKVASDRRHTTVLKSHEESRPSPRSRDSVGTSSGRGRTRIPAVEGPGPTVADEGVRGA